MCFGAGPFSFSKNERILKRKDFVNLNRLGKRQHTPHFTIIFNRNWLGTTRLGIAVSKKTGNSVKRNRVKRLVREFFRLHKAHFPRGYDLLIIARKGATDLDTRRIREELGAFILDKESVL
jgi:ribonuclease P protein component